MSPASTPRISIHDFRRMKREGKKLVVITAYDAPVARLVDDAGVDCILVGDTLGMVIQGHDSTLPVTLEQIIYHTAAVRRGLGRSRGHAHLVADMPFGSYQASRDEAVLHAARLLAEGGAEAVKLEGGSDYGDVVRAIVRAGVPVMGHIGLTPQSIHRFGGHRVQGRDPEQANQLRADARALEAAGCYALVLECVPCELARAITSDVGIPTIGIGAGPACDGQVLVLHDLLGIDTGVSPRFVKQYAAVGQALSAAVEEYAAEVRQALFPADEHCFHAPGLGLG
jgi:3-methyl-2-oxobutanoate hydroxymethyltransferase